MSRANESAVLEPRAVALRLRKASAATSPMRPKSPLAIMAAGTAPPIRGCKGFGQSSSPPVLAGVFGVMTSSCTGWVTGP